MVSGNSTLPEADVGIPAGDFCIWIADKSTPRPAAFGSDQWMAKITLRQAPWSGDNFHVYVGCILPGVGNSFDFTVMDTGEEYQVTGQGLMRWFKVNWAWGGLIVPAGGWLAFKVVNETCRDPLKLRTGQSHSWIDGQDAPVALFSNSLLASSSGLGSLAWPDTCYWGERN